MSALDRASPSFRNAEHTIAPAHWWRTYSANGQEVIQNAESLTSTRQRPGGTNCGAPGFWRL